MTRPSLLLITLGLLTACTGWSHPACRNNAHFCKPAAERAAELPSLSDSDLLAVTILYYRYAKPPISTYSDEIGRRGRRGLAIFRDAIVKDDPMHEAMAFDIAVSLREYSRIDVCELDDPHEGGMPDAASRARTSVWQKTCAIISRGR